MVGHTPTVVAKSHISLHGLSQGQLVARIDVAIYFVEAEIPEVAGDFAIRPRGNTGTRTRGCRCRRGWACSRLGCWSFGHGDANDDTQGSETNRQKADREGRLRIAVFGDGMDWLGVGPLSYFFHNLFALFTLIYLRVEHMLSNEMTQMRHSKENQKRTLHLLSPPCPFRLAGLCNFGRNRFFDKYISKYISSFLVPTT